MLLIFQLKKRRKGKFQVQVKGGHDFENSIFGFVANKIGQSFPSRMLKTAFRNSNFPARSSALSATQFGLSGRSPNPRRSRLPQGCIACRCATLARSSGPRGTRGARCDLFRDAPRACFTDRNTATAPN